jgi:hypothetical protein
MHAPTDREREGQREREQHPETSPRTLAHTADIIPSTQLTRRALHTRAAVGARVPLHTRETHAYVVN